MGRCSLIEQELGAGDYEVEVRGFANRAHSGYVLTVNVPGGIECGNGEVEDGEECDDGNREPGDGCNAGCLLEECGNGVVDAGEACDDGNLDNGDGCSDACEDEILCGDGDLEEGEECDDGNVENGDGCDENCAFEAVCGNGELEGGEECDDGNVENGDGCDALCTGEVFDLIRGIEVRTGSTAPGQRDDYRFTVDHTQSQMTARTSDGAGACDGIGDTTLSLFPVGDDGNLGERIGFDDDGGDGVCSLLAADLDAGNYLLRVQGFGGNPGPLSGYQLDFRLETAVDAGGNYDGAFAPDGNDLFTFDLEGDGAVSLETGDGAGGCPPGDTIITLFGFDEEGGRVQVARNDDGGEGLCSLIAQDLAAGAYELVVIGFGGGANAGYVLTVNLPGGIECGNGEVEDGEECDDGNLENGDGCNEGCQLEECGNEVLDEGEECDDGNVEPGDGCNENCEFEAVCGDGEVEGGEECDDGNLENGDGCDALCTGEVFDLIRGLEQRTGSFPQGQTDVYRFTADDFATMRAQTSDGGDGCPGDTRLQLFPIDLDGNRGDRIGFDDDGGTGVCSLLTTAGLLPGNYELVVDGFGGGSVEGYTLDFRLETEVDEGGDFAGAVAQNGNDLFTFTVEGDATITAFTGDGAGGCPQGDTFMTLFGFDEGGARIQLATNDDGGAGLCSRISRDYGPGDYEIEVRGFGNGAHAGYLLTVEGLGAPAEENANCAENPLWRRVTCQTGEWVWTNDRQFPELAGAEENRTLFTGCTHGRGDNDDGLCSLSGAGWVSTQTWQMQGCNATWRHIGGAFSGNCGGHDGDNVRRLVTGDDGCFDYRELPPPGPGVEAECGNFRVEGGEQCDDGNNEDGDGCSAECEIVEQCGNGEIEGDEQCDDGNLDNNDGCDEECQIEPPEALANCEQNPLWRPVTCETGEWVWTSNREFPELADAEANLTLFTGCTHANDDNDDGLCSLDGTGYVSTQVWTMAGCNATWRHIGGAFSGNCGGHDGDNVRRLVTGDDGCFDYRELAPPGAAVDPECGNGRVEGGEQCDDGNVDGGDGCDANCQLEPEVECGNQVIEEGEECDDGNLDNGDGCDENCQLEPFCGDGELDEGEQCDDGNVVDGDGCDALCTFERIDLIRGIEVRSGNATPPQQVDVYRFRADDLSVLTAEISDGNGGCQGVSDPFVELFPIDENGDRGAQRGANDDGGTGLCSLLRIDDLEAGDYELEVRELGRRLMAGYQLDFRLETEVDGGGTFAGAVAQNGNDLFTFTLEDAATITGFTGDGEGGCPPGDTFMTLFGIDENGARQPIANDDDGGVGVCSRLSGDLVPGDYEVEVRGFGNDAHAGYVLTVEGFRGPEADPNCADNPLWRRVTCETGEWVWTNDRQFPELADAEANQTLFTGCTHANDDNDDGLCSLDGNGWVSTQTWTMDGCNANWRHIGGRFSGNCGGHDGDNVRRLVTGDDGCYDYRELGVPGPVVEAQCGNGRVEGGEACDDGNDNEIDGCTSECQVGPTCGDGEVEEGEACDDGNQDEGDGCDAQCEIELPACGDGELDDDEECDDGNLDNGDGCDALCTFEELDLLRGLEERDGSTPAGQNLEDLYHFTVDHTSVLRAEISDGNEGCADVADPFVELYPLDENGERGQRRGNNDDGGVGLCSLLQIGDLEPGNYELVVRELGRREMTGYHLDYRLETVVDGGGDFAGAVARNGNDLFTFTVEANTTIAAATGNGEGACPPGDTFMTLFGFDGEGNRQQIATNDDGGVGLCSRIEREYEPGDYEIEVRGFGNGPHAGYVLTVEIIRNELSFPGVQNDLPLADVIAGGFEVCFTDLYGADLDTATMMQACDGAVLMVACRQVGQDNLQVAAMGLNEEVFTVVPNEREASHDHNGVQWYYGEDYSMGFANVGQTLARNQCDVNDEDAATRLCWHTVGAVGGYRCGATEGLNNNNDWERLVLHRGGDLPEPPQ